MPETGRTTAPVACVTVSEARTSSIGETALNRSGNATVQWFAPRPVTAPFVMTECAAIVFRTRISRSIEYWSKTRFAGSHASA